MASDRNTTMADPRLIWNNTNTIKPARRYSCGHCGVIVAANSGYWPGASNPVLQEALCICPHCNRPTYFDEGGRQVPGIAFGEDVQHLPADVGGLYSEARNCLAVEACTA